MTVQSKRF